MMGLLDCAKPQTGGITTIDGIGGNVFTRMNYAPAEFQNVKFEKTCEAPFVKIVALRDIAAGEELWVDYGPNYRYDFMNMRWVLDRTWANGLATGVRCVHVVPFHSQVSLSS